LTTTSLDVRDRVPSSRFVRNLALSLSGGALLTLIGAGVAHANEAGTASDGSGAAGTGDATAVGNRSGTQATQGGQASSSGSNLQIINQNAGVANVGVAVANTGGNVAVGNASSNDAQAEQTATGGPLGLAINNGNASNASDGRGFIQTGDASAIGNESGTTIDQRADASAHGTLGGVLVLSQNALVVNGGLGVANTGVNGAVGNASGRLRQNGGTNSAGLLQEALNEGGPGGATNTGSASNDSNGKATISTGNASATGNRADTKVSQVAGSGDGDGPDPSGLTVITQVGGALNAGAALASTGGNRAAGNLSSSGAYVVEPPPTLGDPAPQFAGVDVGGVGLANNNGSATNASDGTAWIATGDASAIGSDSRTAVVQDAHAELGDQGVNLQTQVAPVVNVGLGVANTGGNRAVGNISGNAASVIEDATGTDVLGLALLAIVNNSGEAANSSNGSATVHTGDAWAQGNRSDTSVHQVAAADGTALAVQTQAELVANVGVAIANTGGNRAVGNASSNAAQVEQSASLAPLALVTGLATVNNSGSASNDSDGTASVTTGDAWASGNDSTTQVSQAIDPTGMAVQTQAALVVNAGLAVSNTGLNRARGNASNNGGPANGAQLSQDVEVDPILVLAGVVTVGNQGEAANTSDGSASISTGDAWSQGNNSRTNLVQDATASVQGLGGAVNTQVGVVANVGLGVANTGANGATGNGSTNLASGLQDNDIAGGRQTSVVTGVLTSTDSGSATNDTDGSAAVVTGKATAHGNQSATDFRQDADAEVRGLGLVVNTQVGGVLNAGAGVANTGGNRAVGNASRNEAFLNQNADLGDDAEQEPSNLTLVAPVVTNSNSGRVVNASDGTGEVHTGDAMAWGNNSDTRFVQATDGTVDGLGAVVNTQLGGVANVGLGVANTGINRAAGNLSSNDAGDNLQGAGLVQDATLGDQSGSSPEVTALGPVTNGNFGEVANRSDGLGSVRSGDAQAQGNVAATAFEQQASGAVGDEGVGIVPNVQVAGVLNLGVGVANTGLNGAVGNASGTTALPAIVVPLTPPGNHSELVQFASIVPNGSDLPLVAGPITNTNSGEAGSTSDGSAKVSTGDALATGNVSTSNLTQRVHGDVDGRGLVVGPQFGAIVNVGVGVANSGVNLAVGNLSNSSVIVNAQGASFNPGSSTTVLGPLTVGNNGSATNTSDGDACVCTGDAVATGNVSTSTLDQDLTVGVDDGLSVVPMTGLILNAGFGLANSGVNLAIGNISQNSAQATQSAQLDDNAPTLLVGPQTFVDGGGADNASAGTGKVGTGNAKADGNISTSDLTQKVDVDGAGAFALVNGGIGNIGLGVANAGVNAGIGNASRNSARLDQDAVGSGTVTSQGRASNSSDGFGGVGDPNCDVPGETPGAPGVPSLPKTGGPLEFEAALGLMLLLAGFAFERLSRRVEPTA
jgi:hypothetical protein